MSVYKPAKSPFYAYDFRRGGQRYSGSTGKTERREAEATERHLIREAEDLSGPDGRTGLGRRHTNAPTIADAADRYWTEVCQHGASPDADLAALVRLAALIGPTTILADVDDAVVSKAVTARRAQFRKDTPKLGLVSASTVNRSVTDLLKRLLRRARQVWKITLPEIHWGSHRLSEPKERVRELRYDEEERLEATERADYRAPRLFAQMTGLRRREVANLSWSQIDFANGIISVVGKGDKPHVLPITSELETLLRPLLGHHVASVFTYVCTRTRVCARSGKAFVKGERYAITENGLATQMRRAIAKAGITGLRPMHDFRHTAATRTLRATGNLRLVQQLLNHASPATTAKYAHASLDDMREGMAKAASDSSRRRARMSGVAPVPAGEDVAPIHLAIAAHRIALEGFRASTAFLDATGQEYRKRLVWPAQDAADESVSDLLNTPCGSRAGAEAMVAHLQWYLPPKAVQPPDGQPTQASEARTRLADLLMLLGKRASASSAPIRAAIEAHRAAWAALLQAPPKAEGWDEAWFSTRAAAHHTMGALLEVPCGNVAGARVLLQHLRVFTAELAGATDDERDGAAFGEAATSARCADLELLLGEIEASARLPDAVPTWAASGAPIHV